MLVNVIIETVGRSTKPAIAAKKIKADFAVVAPKVGGVTAATGELIEGDFNSPVASVLFGAVFLALSGQGATALSTEAAAVALGSRCFCTL